MKLNLESLDNRSKWENAGFRLPEYKIEDVRNKTFVDPNWIHFGAGNIFRAFLSNIQQNILNQKKAEKGIIAVGSDSIESIYQAHDNLSVLVTLKVDGGFDKTVIGSITESIVLDIHRRKSWDRLKEIFINPGLQMSSFTITEKGYNLKDSKGDYLADVIEDFENGYDKPVSFMGQITALLYERFNHGGHPIAMVSMDNVVNNGSRLHETVLTYANFWEKHGLVDSGFIDYLNNPKAVSFPWTMIDKITPRPDNSVRDMLKKVGFEDVEDIITARGSFVSPFVNAEESEYLVIEDVFPNGRPNLEDGGVIFTDRDTVNKVEKMKVCTCLNPLHTALAIYGCLLGYNRIYQTMEDPILKRLVEGIGYEEGLPVVVNPGIIDPKEFIDEVIKIRFPNPFIPDQPQRIATDTSQKLGIRYGETIKAYASRDDLDVNDLTLIPLVIAGWLRYLMSVDDKGNRMELSPDPLLEELLVNFQGISLGDEGPFHKELEPILSNKDIFGVDLYKLGLGERIESYFIELIKGPGSVRETLQSHLY